MRLPAASRPPKLSICTNSVSKGLYPVPATAIQSFGCHPFGFTVTSAASRLRLSRAGGPRRGPYLGLPKDVYSGSRNAHWQLCASIEHFERAAGVDGDSPHGHLRLIAIGVSGGGITVSSSGPASNYDRL